MSAFNIGLVVFGLYLAGLLLIGLVASRHQKTSEDFWVAGRRFGLITMVMANVAAIMHGGSILSGVAFAGRFGGVAVLPNLAFAGGFAVIFFVLAAKLRRSRGLTLPDYMGDRFDSNFLRGFSALVVAGSSVIYLIAQIRGMGFILERLLGVPFFWGLVLGTLIFVTYVAMGGLLAVVWTNIAQFILMWTGLIIMGPFVAERIGGLASAIQQVEAVAPGWTSPRGLEWSWSYWVSWYVIWFVAYCTRIELITKMFAAKNERVARCSLPWSILLIIVFLFYGNFYLGAAARVLVWNQIASPDQAFPALITLVLPPVLAAFALTGVASAAMSTTDSLLLMSGAAVSHDFLRKCIHEPRGIQKDEKYYLSVSRLSIVAIGVLAFLGAIPDVALILRIVSYAIAIVGATFFFPLVVGLTSKRLGRAAATAASVGGATTTCLWIWWTLAGFGWAQDIHPGIIGLVTAASLMFLVNPLSGPIERARLQKYFSEDANAGIAAG